MAFKITAKCTACGDCLDACPIESIAEGDPIFVIDDTCVDFQECLVACPEDAIVPADEE